MEGTFNRALKVIQDNKYRAEHGIANCIPFGLPRLQPYLPGLQKKNYTIITASTGVGKSKFAKILYVLKPYEFVKSHPDMGIKFNTFYFCLEESKEAFVHSLMSYKLMADYGLRVPVKHLKSYTHTLSNEIAEKVRGMHVFFDEFEDSVKIIDHVKNPFGIYKEVKMFLDANGTWSKKEVIRDDKPVLVNDTYTSTHPDHYTQVVLDHFSLIHPEKDYPTLHSAMGKMSSDYFLILRDKYNSTITAVQQQSADKEKQQFTFKGQSIESKLEPSLDGLADNKLTGRDADEVLGLFAPDRYEITNHRGYKVDTLEDNYRGLILLKQRDGEANIRAGLFFDGASNSWEELPKASELTDEAYNLYLAKVDRYRDPRQINFG